MRHMIDVGKQVRYNRITDPETGRTLIVPFDHGIIKGPLPGIEDPALTVRNAVAGGANAVLFNAGMAQHLYREYMGRCGTIFNLSNMITDEADYTLISTVDYALRNGADAVSVQVAVGGAHEKDNLNDVRVVADACQRWGMPLLAMMYWGGGDADPRSKAERYLHVARAGAELGVDIVKTVYTGPDDFRKMVASCPAPIVIAGGEKAGTLRDVLALVRDAIDAGAIGVALGRNVWQSDEPVALARALANIVHGGKSVEEAYPAA